MVKAKIDSSRVIKTDLRLFSFHCCRYLSEKDDTTTLFETEVAQAFFFRDSKQTTNKTRTQKWTIYPTIPKCSGCNDSDVMNDKDILATGRIGQINILLHRRTNSAAIMRKQPNELCMIK